jgi:hypothetical protein
LNSFDQWIEALSKQVPIQSDENEMKVLLREKEICYGDFEEEEE